MKKSFQLLWGIYECLSDHMAPVKRHSSLICSKALWCKSDITDGWFGH